MINEDDLQKKQKKILEIIKDYIKPDLLQTTWNNDGLRVIEYFLYKLKQFIFSIKDFNE